MKTYSLRGQWLVVALLAASAGGCSEDGQSIGNGECPADLPLYQFKAGATDPSTGQTTWTRVSASDGTPLTPAENAAISAAEQRQGKLACTTPAGTATTIGAKKPPGSGGAASTDSGAD